MEEKSFNKKIISLNDETFCSLILKNFDTVFLFWKFSKFKVEEFLNNVYQKKIIIVIFDEEKQIMQIEEEWDKGSIYITLPKEDFFCRAEIYSFNNEKQILCKAEKIKIPFQSKSFSIGSFEYLKGI